MHNFIWFSQCLLEWGWKWGGLAWENKTSCPGCFQFDTAYCTLRRSQLRNCQIRLACGNLWGLALADDVKGAIPLWAAPSIGRRGVRKPAEHGSVREAVSSVPPQFQLQSGLQSLPWLSSEADSDLKVWTKESLFLPKLLLVRVFLSWWQRRN